ncbi:hypothetical protein EEL39_13360 [Muribaculaceae bacterium Isolate-080 (Janvier)]|nr:hypothetical protein EEL39_13360 [Muribaculaceae bacterium Isolate-080 (Janvier)]
MQNVEEMLTKSDANFSRCAYKEFTKCLQRFLYNIQIFMAIFKAIVRTKRKDGFYQVYIRCVHNRKPGYIKTDKLVTDKQLDRNGDIDDPFVNEYCARRILEFTQRLNRKEIGKWTVKQVVDFLAMEDEDLCFSDYARLHIDRMRDRGQVRNARNYELALQHLERYAGTTRVMFAQL